MPGKSKLTANDEERAGLRGLSQSARRRGPGAGDPADAGGAECRGDRRGPRGGSMDRRGSERRKYGVARQSETEMRDNQDDGWPKAGATIAASIFDYPS